MGSMGSRPIATAGLSETLFFNEPVRAGAKVGDAEIEGVQTEEIRYGVKVPTWVAEVVDKATKEGWFD